jgi:NADH-quinone oxidoreductase subunit H
MYATWAERKIAAVIQDRLGPNRAGPFGLLQPVADGLKLFMKEEIIPSASSKFLFITGPCTCHDNCADDKCCYSMGTFS